MMKLSRKIDYAILLIDALKPTSEGRSERGGSECGDTERAPARSVAKTLRSSATNGVNALTRKSHRYVPISEIALKNNLPRLFIEKIAQKLLVEGILQSKKGKIGGYRLKKDPKKITLLDIIKIFEHEGVLHCVKYPRPNEACPIAKFSLAEKRWAEVDQKINKIFQEATFAQW